MTLKADRDNPATSKYNGPLVRIVDPKTGLVFYPDLSAGKDSPSGEEEPDGKQKDKDSPEKQSKEETNEDRA